MGTFSYFLGEMDIPEERREEFAQGALKLLRAGGMLIAEPTSMFGHQIYLLHPPELDEEGRAYGCYNYFEDDCWESWSLDAKNGRFACGKIGYRQFHAVALAMGVYTSLYCKSFSAATLESRLLYEGRFIGWINYVLGTQYTNQRATQLWEIGKLLQLDDDYWVRCNPDLGHLLEDYPPECADRDQTLSCLAAYHFDELCSILPPLTDEGWEELKQSKMLTIQAIYD